MDRVAVFVDAGYLYAQGSAAIAGSKKPRTSIALDTAGAVATLKSVANETSPECRLLRIYWYDGAVAGSRPTAEQALLANSDDIKLRLGFVNSQGEQKGVDSLIVTDLIELARLKSISEAVLLSGDEDVRIGVQIAQNYGVRVHLLGIVPSRGSQSHQLLQEADTTREWTAGAIAAFMAIREPVPERSAHALAPSAATMQATIVTGVQLGDGPLVVTVDSFVSEMTEAEIQGIQAYWQSERGVPQEFDRKLLPICGQALGRNLEREEIRQMRSRFQQAVKLRLAQERQVR